jgi:hypothetical protein
MPSSRFTDPLPSFAGKPPTEAERKIIEQLIKALESPKANTQTKGH